jgi:hypothetical protein
MSLKDFIDDELDLKEQLEKMAKESIGRAMNKTRIDNLDIGEIAKNFQKTLLDMLKPFSDKVDEYQTVIKEMGGISALLKTSWNLEEETVDVVTFESLVVWSKKHFKKDKYSAACFLAPKPKSNDMSSHYKDEVDSSNEYNLFFLDKNNQPLLDGSQPHKIFYAKTIDADLKAQLVDKNMLLLN